MGTRGLMAFNIDGELKGAYNHFDSYPSGLGADISKWIEGDNFDLEKAREQARRLEAVKEEEKPTDEQIEKLMKYANLNVSNRSLEDWYALLRETQGDPQATLDAVFYIDGTDFAGDSLFCEWGYVIDLDEENLEIYRGFNTEGEVGGRFSDMKPDPEDAKRQEDMFGYYYRPINLVRVVPFSELDTFDMEALEENLEAEENDE